ncbi:MAG TPA: hypothetical protein VF618_00880 [Thermoanaerobaculia bacterium]
MSDEIFEFGERTIMQLRNQQFTPDEEFGTVVLRPTTTPATPLPSPALHVTGAEPAASADPMVRLEQKLDAALHLIASMQQRLDSLDATLARFLMQR